MLAKDASRGLLVKLSRKTESQDAGDEGNGQGDKDLGIGNSHNCANSKDKRMFIP